MSAALERVRPMLVAIGGPRGWSDTKDHWRNRLARRLDMNARRVRAILSNNEKVSLSADEYLRIEVRLTSALASILGRSTQQQGLRLLARCEREEERIRQRIETVWADRRRAYKMIGGRGR